MRSFRRFFTLLFVAATLLSSVHELIHHHKHQIDHHEIEECALDLIANIPLILGSPLEIHLPGIVFTPYIWRESPRISADLTPFRSRSPPTPSSLS